MTTIRISEKSTWITPNAAPWANDHILRVARDLLSGKRLEPVRGLLADLNPSSPLSSSQPWSRSTSISAPVRSVSPDSSVRYVSARSAVERAWSTTTVTRAISLITTTAAKAVRTRATASPTRRPAALHGPTTGLSRNAITDPVRKRKMACPSVLASAHVAAGAPVDRPAESSAESGSSAVRQPCSRWYPCDWEGFRAEQGDGRVGYRAAHGFGLDPGTRCGRRATRELRRASSSSATPERHATRFVLAALGGRGADPARDRVRHLELGTGRHPAARGRQRAAGRPAAATDRRDGRSGAAPAPRRPDGRDGDRVPQRGRRFSPALDPVGRQGNAGLFARIWHWLVGDKENRLVWYQLQGRGGAPAPPRSPSAPRPARTSTRPST